MRWSPAGPKAGPTSTALAATVRLFLPARLLTARPVRPHPGRGAADRGRWPWPSSARRGQPAFRPVWPLTWPSSRPRASFAWCTGSGSAFSGPVLPVLGALSRRTFDRAAGPRGRYRRPGRAGHHRRAAVGGGLTPAAPPCARRVGRHGLHCLHRGQVPGRATGTPHCGDGCRNADSAVSGYRAMGAAAGLGLLVVTALPPASGGSWARPARPLSSGPPTGSRPRSDRVFSRSRRPSRTDGSLRLARRRASTGPVPRGWPSWSDDARRR